MNSNSPSQRIFDSEGELDLTPTAAGLVDAYLEQVRRNLIDEVTRARVAHIGGSVRAGEVKDAILRSERRNKASSRRTRVVLFAALASSSMLLLALLATIFVWQEAAGTKGSPWLPGVVGVAIGSYSAVIGIIYGARSRRVKDSKDVSASHFLDAARDLEDLARIVAEQSVGPESKIVGLSKVLSVIQRLGFWNTSDVDSFRKILGLRNSIVHETGKLPTSKELRDGERQARGLIDSLEAAARNPGARLAQMAYSFEDQIANAIRRSNAAEPVAVSHDLGYDISVTSGAGAVAVVVKYLTKGSLSLPAVLEAVGKVRADLGVVVVTNAPLDPAVRQYNAADRERPVEVVQWNGVDDDGILVRALARSVR